MATGSLKSHQTGAAIARGMWSETDASWAIFLRIFGDALAMGELSDRSDGLNGLLPIKKRGKREGANILVDHGKERLLLLEIVKFFGLGNNWRRQTSC